MTNKHIKATYEKHVALSILNDIGKNRLSYGILTGEDFANEFRYRMGLFYARHYQQHFTELLSIFVGSLERRLEKRRGKQCQQ
jgi:hypothetical protein